MTGDALLFFNDCPQSIPLYTAFDEALKNRLGQVTIRVQKTQITYAAPRVFACVSRPRRKGESGVLVTLGLGRRERSPRVAIVVEPYPGRWTHHIPIVSPEEIDEQLMGWVEEACRFALEKGK